MKSINLGFFVAIFLVIMAPSISHAQTGIIRGSVIEDATGEPFFGATVVIEGTTNGASTDFDGKFEIKASPGTYSLRVSFVSYKTIIIEGVEVSPTKVALLENIRMAEDVETLAEVVITAEAIKTTEQALLTVKKKSANLIDGISSANFSKIGDSDAASAVKRVPGVSIEGGKYVYVRGLGDRYTKSILNGMDIPGLDPDRNTVQMDLFPTSLIDNIIVLKSFTGDLPADFTGGVVNISTKEFPEEKIFKLSTSIGYNPSMHFNGDYLTYPGSSTDFLGFDDGMRAIPTEGLAPEEIPLYPQVVARPDTEEGRQFSSILNKFNPTLGAMRQNSMMNYGMGLTYGNQNSIRNKKLGYFVTLNYSSNTEYYQNVEYGRYGKRGADVFDLERRELQQGEYGTYSVNLSGLAGVALKGDRSKYTFNILHTQNGESKAAYFDYENNDLGAVFDADQHNLEYSQRSLTNVLLSGVHYSADNSWQYEWKLSPTVSQLDDPDIRFTRIRKDGGNFTIGTESGNPERIWRFLTEYNLSAKTDISKDMKMFGNDAKIKFGPSFTYKQRDYTIEGFQIIPVGVTITDDPNVLFLEENLWPSNDSGTRGTRFEPGFIPINTNQFDGEIRNTAFYVNYEFNPVKNLRTILGVRAENYNQWYTGQNQQGTVLDNEQVLDDLDFFPAVNLIYGINDNQNLRVSYSKTIARPSFKEASFAEILDPITSRTFIGGFFPDVNSLGEVIWDGNLTATRIDNFDLRWESFQGRGQTVSLSVFYKMFDNPIEIVQYVQTPNNFQPRNVGDGRVLGLELEFRKNLDFLGTMFENIDVSTNFTYTESSIDMTPTEFISRQRNARVGQVVTDTRAMAGQAPYIINAGLAYSSPVSMLDIGLFYNVQGETLTFVGIADRPDVFSVPFHSLNLNINKQFGLDDRMSAGFKVNNILNAKREFLFEAFNAEDQIFTSLTPGTVVSASFSYRF